MLYRNVSKSEQWFSAIRVETNEEVRIEDSVLLIYIHQPRDEDRGTCEYYHAVHYDNQPRLKQIHAFLKGELWRRDEVSDIVIRYGWLDKDLLQTHWIPLVELVTRFYNDTIDRKDKAKLAQVCKLFNLSMKQLKAIKATLADHERLHATLIASREASKLLHYH